MADKAVEEADAPIHLQATKLANVLFTYELQKRLGQHGIQVRSCPTPNFLGIGCCRHWHGACLGRKEAVRTGCGLKCALVSRCLCRYHESKDWLFFGAQNNYVSSQQQCRRHAQWTRVACLQPSTGTPGSSRASP